MAIVALSNSANRLNDFETAVSTVSIGGGGGAGLEVVTFFQGAQSVSRKCTTGDKGYYVIGLTSTDMTAGDDKVWLAKIFVSDGTDATATGIRLYLGNTTANNYEALLYDDGTNIGLYPITRSWLVLPWDPNVVAFRYATNGTPDITINQIAGVVVNLTNGAAKSENVFMDSIDFSDGLYLVGGDGADADGTFFDFQDYDEGTQANRFGHVIAQEGIFYVVGKLIIGRTAGATTTATVFTDEGSVVVFPESKTDTGWNEIEADITNASTVINFTSNTFNGRGTGASKAFFGTTADVDGAVEAITLANYTGTLRTADAVVYSNEGGAQSIGLTNGTTYWINETATIGDWTIHANYSDGLTGTAPINLTAGGAEEHSFQKTPDTRPDFTVTGTGGTFDATSCAFSDFAIFTLTSKATLTSVAISGAEQINQNSAVLTGCFFSGATTEDGEALIVSDDPGKISECEFTFSDGHAIEITATGTYTLTNNTYTGYGADATNDAVIYNNSGGLVTLAVSGGTTPTVRNGTSASTVITNAVTVRVQGVTEGAAVKVVANETVGTITTGDTILEALADATGAAENTSFNYEGAFEPSGLDVIARVRSSGLPTAAIQDDNGVFTDETAEANTVTGSPIPLINLLPAVPVVNQDRYIFGHAEQFNQLKLVMNTAGTGGFTITWQYWNGAWTNLSGVTDGTSSFSVSGTNKVSWTLPGDWVTTTINSQGPYYYVRAAYTSGTVTIVPDAEKCTLDVTKYLPFVQNNIITSAGLTVTASWNEDTIATF